MIQGTHVEPEDLTATILAVVHLARRHLTLISPVVEDAVMKVIREHVSDGVAIEVRSDARRRVQIIVADERVALWMSTSLTVVGTGVGRVEPEEGEEPRVPNVECGLVVEGVDAVEKLLAAATMQ